MDRGGVNESGDLKLEHFNNCTSCVVDLLTNRKEILSALMDMKEKSKAKKIIVTRRLIEMKGEKDKVYRDFIA